MFLDNKKVVVTIKMSNLFMLELFASIGTLVLLINSPLLVMNLKERLMCYFKHFANFYNNHTADMGIEGGRGGVLNHSII